MKQAYLIAQEKNLDRFQEVFESEDIFITTYNAEKIPSLTAFLTRDRAVVQQDFIVIDVGDVSMWSVSHILSAVQHLHRFSNAVVIFIGEPSEDLTELYGTLASVHRISHLITDKRGVDVPEELRRCLIRDADPIVNKTEFITQMLVQQSKQTAKPLNIPPNLVLNVAVSGSMPRCGATTQTFAVYHYLKSLGFKPAILDEHAKLISVMKQYENTNIEDNVVSVRGVKFCTETGAEDFNAYVSDLGELSQKNVARFCDADISILVGCTKPWEVKYLAEAIKKLMGRPHKNSITLASFSSKEDLDKLGANLGDRYAIAPYVDSIWRAPEDVSAYTATLLRVLKELCSEKHSEAPDLEVG